MPSGMNRRAAAFTAAPGLGTGHPHADVRKGRGSAPPAHVLLDVGPRVVPYPFALRAILEEAGHRTRELLRLIGEDNVVAVPDGQALHPDSGRHHRLAHGHGLVGLDARAAADAEGDDEEGAPGHVWTHVLHATQHADLRMHAGPLEELGGGIASYYRDVDGGHELTEPGQHLV